MVKWFLSIFILLSLYCQAGAQNRVDSIGMKVYFRQGHSEFEPSYRGNGMQAETFVEQLRTLQRDSLFRIRGVKIVSGSSPEGGNAANERLSKQRAACIYSYIKQHVALDDSMFEIVSLGPDMQGLAGIIRESDMPYRAEALAILQHESEETLPGNDAVANCKRGLKALGRGRVWGYMEHNFFPELRRAQGYAFYSRRQSPDVVEWALIEDYLTTARTAIGEVRKAIADLSLLALHAEFQGDVRTILLEAIGILQESGNEPATSRELERLLVELDRIAAPEEVMLKLQDASHFIGKADRSQDTARNALESASASLQKAQETMDADSQGAYRDDRKKADRLVNEVTVISRSLSDAEEQLDHAKADLIRLAEPAKEMPLVGEKRKPFYMSLKTNLLYDAALVPNIAAEFYVGRGWAVGGGWMYAWWKNDERHNYWRIYGGELDLRKYFGRRAAEKPLTGHHLGLYVQGVTYDFEMGGKGYQSKFSYGAGIEYGYSLPLGRRLNLDFGIGIGYMGGKYTEYYPGNDRYISRKTKQRHWFGPTKAEISLVWLIGRGNQNQKKGGKR